MRVPDDLAAMFCKRVATKSKKVIRTGLLRYLSDAPLRRRVTAATNKGESLNTAAGLDRPPGDDVPSAAQDADASLPGIGASSRPSGVTR